MRLRTARCRGGVLSADIARRPFGASPLCGAGDSLLSE
jgi:hypothetical protein